MTWRERTAELLKKYKHGWVFSYFLIYIPWFLYLEKHVTRNYHVIHAAIDDKIPFIEYFIVPYLLWFVFIAAVMLYFFFTDKEGYALALRKELAVAVKSPAFKGHMKDILEYRTMEYYRRRYAGEGE